jgi:hypothetical protein
MQVKKLHDNCMRRHASDLFLRFSLASFWPHNEQKEQDQWMVSEKLQNVPGAAHTTLGEWPNAPDPPHLNLTVATCSPSPPTLL